MRKHECFKVGKLTHTTVIANAPKKLYRQERDWTCALACLRTLISGFSEDVPSEDYLINNFCLKPGPHYSKDVKSYRILDDYDVKYGCDLEEYNFDTILDYLEQGYYLMMESMINYAHWMVLLGYYPLDNNNIEQCKLLMYDPYYDNVRLINGDEFISMWRDGNYENTRVDKDFIALKNII